MPRKTTKIVAEICLYGSSKVGHGYLVSLPERKLLGDGEPRKHWSLTDAMFHGLTDIRETGIVRGLVRVFEPTGQRCADVEIGKAWPYFGDLKWQWAAQFAISAQELLAAAE